MNELIVLMVFFIAFGAADGLGIAWDYIARAAASVTNIGYTTADRNIIGGVIEFPPGTVWLDPETGEFGRF